MKKFVFAFLASVIMLVPALPANATTFNIPSSAGGSNTQVNVLNRQIAQEIDRARKGDTVRVSTYGISNYEVRDAALRAIDRGVRFGLLTWDGDDFAAYDKIEARAGSNPKAKDGTWAVKCDGSCASAKKNKGVHHFKAVTNSRTKRTIIGSGNITGTGDVKWNGAATSYDPKIYTVVTKWIEQLAFDKNVKSPKSITSGTWRIDFLPGGPDNRAKEISKVSCKPYVYKGKKVKPIIYIGMMIWTNARDEIAIEAGKKKKAGCDVRAAISASEKKNLNQTDSKVKAALRKYKIPTRNTYAGKVKMHNKVIIIRSKNLNEVITGSANAGGNGVNTNVILTIKDMNEVNQHINWYYMVEDNSPVWNNK